MIVQGINSYYVIDLQYIKKNLLHELSKTQHRENNRKTYRSETFPTELFLATLVSDKKEGWELVKSSAMGKMNEDNNGSGAELDEETIQEEPPKRDCRFPSLNSFLNKERVEWGPPLRDFLLRCM